jgi:hypothetical protein
MLVSLVRVVYYISLGYERTSPKTRANNIIKSATKGRKKRGLAKIKARTKQPSKEIHSKQRQAQTTSSLGPSTHTDKQPRGVGVGPKSFAVPLRACICWDAGVDTQTPAHAMFSEIDRTPSPVRSRRLKPVGKHAARSTPLSKTTVSGIRNFPVTTCASRGRRGWQCKLRGKPLAFGPSETCTRRKPDVLCTFGLSINHINRSRM